MSLAAENAIRPSPLANNATARRSDNHGRCFKVGLRRSRAVHHTSQDDRIHSGIVVDWPTACTTGQPNAHQHHKYSHLILLHGREASAQTAELARGR